MTAPPADGGGFTAFFRRYTKTWLHGVSTAALTAFGALAVLHRGFIAVAIAAYVLPPIVLYAIGRAPADGRHGDPTDWTSPARDRKVTGADTDPPPRGAGRTAGGSTERTSAARSAGSRDVTEETDIDSGPATDGRWRRVDSPTGAKLHDVTLADGDGYAVGADGVVIAGGGDGWRTLLTGGPGAAQATLRGVDGTDDGGALWLAGDGGTVARVDTDTDRHVDFSPPIGRTDDVTDVTTAGPSGDEVVLLVNSSGEVLRGRYRKGELAWGDPVKPGSGSSLAGVALVDVSTGYCCDTNDGVFETTDGGQSFRQVGGVSADGTLTDVAAVARGVCTVSADDGILHRHDDGTWTPVRLDDDPLAAIALDDARGVACGGRAVYYRAGIDDNWERSTTAVPGIFSGVAIDQDQALAVGSEGTIFEWTSTDLG